MASNLIKDSSLNMLSIIIPTFNAGVQFEAILDSLNNQTIKPSLVIIVDSESSDQTRQIAESRNCRVITISRDRFDHGSTRNLAMAEVSSEFVVFLTQDAIPADENMIAELIKPMQADPNIAICYGRQLPRPDARPLERFAREFNYPDESILKTKNDIERLGIKTFFCSNSCSAIRRSIFNKLGGFKNNVIVNEDMLFAAKAIFQDYSVYYSATARVCHSHSYSLRQTFKRYFNIGRFFADNKEIFKHTGLKGYGGNMLISGVKIFRENKMPYYIAALFFELAAKATVCKFGWYYQLLKKSQ